jgi:hypothetical protein
MTTAPKAASPKTVNAVVIRSSVLFERPVLNLNKMKPSKPLKNSFTFPFTGNRFPAKVFAGRTMKNRTTRTKNSMSITFKFVVKSADGDLTGLFIREADAKSFARPTETVEATEDIRDFGDLGIPRRDITGNAASSEAETIGVW